MKNLYTLLLLATACVWGSNTSAQDYFMGVLPQNGPGSAGTVFRVSPDGSELAVTYSFERPVRRPKGGLLAHSNGYFYGIAEAGADENGALYRLDSDGSNFTVLYSFRLSDGSNFSGDLTEGDDGRLYGVSTFGGTYFNNGQIFTIDPNGENFASLHSFDSLSGAFPRSSVTMGRDGKIYGLTFRGGLYETGVIYTLEKDGSDYKVLYNFNFTDGYFPYGRLIHAADGKLYGLTSGGPQNGAGVLFQIHTDGSNFQLLRQFSGLDGRTPFGTLLEARNGKLYGTTTLGGRGNGGIIFEMDPGGNNFRTVYEWEIYQDKGEFYPGSDLFEGSDGKLYGILGGKDPLPGAVFSVEKDGSNYQVLHHFDGPTGAFGVEGFRYWGVVQGADGKIYGTTSRGGLNNQGVIFRVDTDGNNFTALEKLGNSETGYQPVGSLLRGTDGNLYGMTARGGAQDKGTLFRADPNGQTITTLWAFDGTNGASPMGDLMQARDGRLYGMTPYGGEKDFGVIFGINTDGSDFALLHTFTEFAIARPEGSLIQHRNGKLYGTTPRNGALFEIAPDGSGFEILHYFDDSTGNDAGGTLLEHTDGALYGLTYDVIFRIAVTTGEYTVLHKAGENISKGASGALIAGSDGKFYGLTPVGGPGDNGTIFSIRPDGSDYRMLHAFDIEKGYYPFGDLTEGDDGRLYGMASEGGQGYGLIFRIEKDGSNFEMLRAFDRSTGGLPTGNLLPVKSRPRLKPGQNFCLFPNPAQNWVNVEILSGNTQTPHTVELLTLYGGLVDRRDLA
ncbi:MAG: hypothetical protein SF052_10535, partial [Bacteroidia bacterium]|nr:hypothetical protein [Bacteroidia bacterium]